MKEISAQDLKQKLDNKEDIQLIDVRESFEQEIASIGGELIPMGEIMDSEGRISKDKPVIIYCRTGRRSAVAIMNLESRFGFTNLYNLKGGIAAYSQEVDPSIPTY